MCIAIYKPSDVEINELSRDRLAACWTQHNDGAGFMYVKDGKIEVFRELTNFQRFYEAFRNIPSVEHRNVILHFRFATIGDVMYENIHPQQVSESVAFVHNGTLSTSLAPLDIETPAKSDTAVFCNLLKKLKRQFYNDSTIMHLIANAVKSSKLVLLTNQDDVHIINESDGIWDEGIWYSNLTYLDSDPIRVLHQSRWDGDMLVYDGDMEPEGSYKYQCSMCPSSLDLPLELKAGVCEDCLEDMVGTFEEV